MIQSYIPFISYLTILNCNKNAHHVYKTFFLTPIYLKKLNDNISCVAATAVYSTFVL